MTMTDFLVLLFVAMAVFVLLFLILYFLCIAARESDIVERDEWFEFLEGLNEKRSEKRIEKADGGKDRHGEELENYHTTVRP